MKKYLSMLQTYQFSSKERAALLKAVQPDLIHAVWIVTNIMHDWVSISQKQKGVMVKNKKSSRGFSNK